MLANAPLLGILVSLFENIYKYILSFQDLKSQLETEPQNIHVATMSYRIINILW